MQASDSRKRAAEGDGGMVQVPAELVEALREAERHYRMTHAGEFANSLEYAARALVDAVEKPAPTVPRIARSIDELRVGMVVAVSGPFGSGVVRTVERVGGPWVTAGKFDTGRKIHPEDVANGYVFILSEPPVPTLPTNACVIRAKVKSWPHPRILFGHPNPGEESGMTFCRALDGLGYKVDEIESFEVLWEDTND